jgi:hypothetical protein
LTALVERLANSTDTKIGELDGASVGEEHVGGLEVAMNDKARMKMLETEKNLANNIGNMRLGKRTLKRRGENRKTGVGSVTTDRRCVRHHDLHDFERRINISAGTTSTKLHSNVQFVLFLIAADEFNDVGVRRALAKHGDLGHHVFESGVFFNGNDFNG